jgi:hypothetical protein
MLLTLVQLACQSYELLIQTRYFQYQSLFGRTSTTSATTFKVRGWGSAPMQGQLLLMEALVLGLVKWGGIFFLNHNHGDSSMNIWQK